MSATVQQIIDAVADRVETVTPANGYSSDLAGLNGLYRQDPVGDKETLALFITPTAKRLTEAGEFGIKRRELPFEVTVIVQGQDAAAEALLAVSEIEQAFRADHRLGGLARFCLYDFAEVATEQGRSLIAGQQITINVTFNET